MDLSSTSSDTLRDRVALDPRAGSPIIAASGRILLAGIFLVSGIGKIGAYTGTLAYMSAFGVPGAFLPFVIALEILSALAIMIGWKTRLAALALAAYTFLTAVLFHRNFADPIQEIMFLKNISMVGGFLLLASYGAGAMSIDGRPRMRGATVP